MKLVAGVMVVMCGCLITPVMHFGSGKTAQEAQHQEYTRVSPAAFARKREWGGEVSTAKIRVWADDAYRAQNIHWERTFQDQLDATNEVLAASFGVRLVADYRPWQRHAPGASLADGLQDLAQTDAGDDVLSVIGLTSSLSLVSATFEQLGYASIGGRHVMVRGYADVEERKVFEAAFAELRAEERDLLYQQRRRHKTTAVLLHELGHNLGADHVPDEDTLMHDTYSERSAAFDAHSREIILATLDQRLRRGHPIAPAGEPPPPEPQAHSDVHAKLYVDIDDAGHEIVGGHPLDGETLDGLLELCVADDGSTEVIVKATRKAPHAAIVDVIDRAKAAGLTRVTLVPP